MSIIDLINAVRAANGIAPLSANAQLGDAAAGHARDMAAHLGMVHIGSDGSDGGERIRRAGYDWKQWGEVVGWGFGGNIAAMVDWWMNSPEHRPYLLDARFVDAGVGYEYAPGSRWGHYWVVDFGRNGSTSPPPPPPRPDHVVHVPVVVGGKVQPGLDLLRFKLADPDCWRVVRHPGGAQEDVQDMQLGGGLFVRRKGSNGEWHRYDDRFFYLVHDTSPDVGTEGIERVYTLYKDGVPGAPKSKRFQAVGEQWHEAGLHRVQFRARHSCRPLGENSGDAQNHSTIVRHERDYTFNRYGQNLTFDEVIFEKTGVETQVYGRKDGRACGWVGWDAPWGSSEPVEIHWGRGRLTVEPQRWCGF